MLALFDTELPAADDAFALVCHWPSGTVSTDHSRMPTLLLPGGVVCEEFRIVVAPAPPPAVVLHFAESVREGITVGLDHPAQLDVRRRLPDHPKRCTEGFEQRCVARAYDLPRCPPNTGRIAGKQIAQRVGHPARIGRMDVVAAGERVLDWVAPLEDEEGSYDEKYGGFHLADQGHETCWLIRSKDGVYSLSRMSRGNGWHVKLTSPLLDDVERYLVASFGPQLRRRVLPTSPPVSATRPWDPEAGWGPVDDAFILQAHESGFRLQSLGGGGRSEIRVICFTSEDEAISFSRYGGRSVEDLKASFLDGLGRPLLPVESAKR